MSQDIGGYPGTTGTDLPNGQPTTQVARDEATEVGRTAADAGRQVAGTAAEQATNVAQEVKTQARDLVGEARGQVQHQARAGQQKAADGVRALSRELREMAEGGQQSGPVSEVARQAAERADRLADWLTEREPGDLVEEVRSFARRRPGTFLLGSLVAGVVVGRLTRGAVDAARADSGPAPQHGYGPGYAPRPVPPLPYERPPAPYGGPTGPAVPPTGLPPVPPAPPAPPVPPHRPAPPPGYAAPPPSSPLPPSPGPAHDLDPLAPPAGPTGRHSPGTVGEYVDELEGRRGTVDPLDDPYQPGGGEFRRASAASEPMSQRLREAPTESSEGER